MQLSVRRSSQSCAYGPPRASRRMSSVTCSLNRWLTAPLRCPISVPRWSGMHVQSALGVPQHANPSLPGLRLLALGCPQPLSLSLTLTLTLTLIPILNLTLNLTLTLTYP